MRNAFLVLVCGALTTAPAATPPAPPVSKGPSALLQKVTGAVTLAAAAEAKAAPIGEQDVGRALARGQVVHVAEGGQVELLLGSGPLALTDPGDFVIPAPPSEKKGAVLLVLERYLHPAGAVVGPASAIVSPAPGGLVQAGSFTMKWDTRQWTGMVALRVTDEMGTELWSKSELPAGVGAFESAEARLRLTAFRHATEQRIVVFTMTSEDGVTTSSRCRLLSQTDEKRVQAALAQWDKETEAWAKPAGRAALLLEAQLYNDAEAEAERALAEAPSSKLLRQGLAEVERRLGRENRAEELTAEPEK